MTELFSDIYRGKRVFLTGHTGFKGSWMSYWLSLLGADMVGYALSPATDPSHFNILNLNIKSIIGDIRDATKLQKVIEETKPDIVFNMAAQSLVLHSYRDPVTTFGTNVMGCVNLFEACRKTDSVRAIVNITSDKCYRNQERISGYRENDPIGGEDPYSASKGCAELVTFCWRSSFFPPDEYGKKHQTLIASARAGNVIGGGDWSQYRIVPDIIRSIKTEKPALIRHPMAIRPWQHVLEPLSGYLMLGQKLMEGKKGYADAWNFGPLEEACITVGEIAHRIKTHWNALNYMHSPDQNKHNETNLLKLDSSKARNLLKWQPVWDISKTIKYTVDWYKSYYEREEILTRADIDRYVKDAEAINVDWITR